MEDLRARLSELDATYSEAQQRRDDVEARRKHLKELEREKEELLASYEILARESLEGFPLKTGMVYIGVSILR